MDIISFNEASTANGRIEKFIENPDSTSGIVTVPKTIASGESVTVPAGRVAVLPNVRIDGEIVVEGDGEIFVPSGSSLDFSTGIKVNGEKLTMSIPTAYHIYNGSVEAAIKANNTELTSTTTKNYTTADYIFCYSNSKLYGCILNSTSEVLLTNTTYFTEVSAGDISINALVPYANGIDVNGSKVSIEYKNETITGLTLPQGKNYVYSKNDGTYGVSRYEPMYGSLRDRSVAGENPDYFDLKTMKWYSTTGGNELVTNGTFDVDTNGWTAGTDITVSWESSTLKLTTTGANTEVGAYQNITTVVGKKYIFTFNYAWTSDYINWAIDDGKLTSIVASGKYTYEFIAQNTTTKIEFFRKTPNAGQVHRFDNISVFEAVPTIGAEIIPRTYLDCIVYADQNRQVSYVEELPKTTYFDEVKANEFKGKNACTALVRVNTLVSPILIREYFGITGLVKIGVGVYDLYLEKEVDINKVILSGSTSLTGSSLTVDYTNSTSKKIRVISHRSDHNGNFGAGDGEVSIQIFGGIN